MLEVFLRSYQNDLGATSPAAFPVPEESLPFAKWKINEIRKILAANMPMEHRHAWLMYEGDHWQGGWGYAGPMVDLADPAYSRLWGEILKMFTSRNVVREIAKTHVNGVLGRPMRWSLVPARTTRDERDDTDDDLKELIAEASGVVRQWLQTRNAHEMLRKFLLDMLMPPGKAVLRLWLPRGAGTPITEGSRVLGREAGDDFARTMAGIFVEKPDVKRARVYTDPETQRQASIALFRARGANGQFQDAASLSFLDAEGERTIVAVIYEDRSVAAVGYQLGGRLLAFQGERDPIITQQLLQQQRILNYAESTIPRNLTTAGFLDRILKSVQLNGEYVVNEDGSEEYVVDPASVPRFGPAEVTVLQPIVLEDDEGKLTVTNPDMIRGEPVQPDGSIKSSDHIYRNMQREAGMPHLVPGEDSDGAVIVYGLSLLESAIPCTAALRWMIETALAWGEDLRGERGRYTDQLRVQASCFLNVGPVTPEQRDALTRAFEKSILSRETAQEFMGVEDVDEENDRIAAQPGAAIDLEIRKANSYKMLIEAGMPPRLAALHSGYSEEDAEEIATEAEKLRQQQVKEQQETLKLEASLAPKPVAGQRGTGTAGLRSKRQGRPSGTKEQNPGQGQDRGARASTSKPRSRKPV